MHIRNINVIIKELRKKININKEVEYGYFLGLEYIKGEFIIKSKIDLLGERPRNDEIEKIVLSKNIISKFIMWCKQRDYLPMVIHTHPFYLPNEQISFSHVDYRFNNSFINFGHKCGLYEFVFMVTNCISYQIIYYNNTYEEEIMGFIENVNRK